MHESSWLTERFEEHRGHLRAVAYRMLGSLPDADDAVQDAWIRFSRSGAADEVENLGGFLTTIVARVCLNILRARGIRPEDLAGVHVPDPIITSLEGADPETEALLADSVGLALMVVLDTLAPADRVAFVLHDIFDVPFREIAPIVGRTEPATRQLASRARRQVHTSAIRAPDRDRNAQRALVDAFFAAARGGNFNQLVILLDPDVVLLADGGARHPEASATLRGSAAVARRALMFPKHASDVHAVLVNGTAGAIVTARGRPFAVFGFTVLGGRITEIHGLADPDRLSRLDLPVPSR